jgi:MFS family permease
LIQLAFPVSDKHRSLATGIVTSGSGLGGMIFPILVHYLIEYYGWKGSMFILAGLMLQCVVLKYNPANTLDGKYAMANPIPVKTDSTVCYYLYNTAPRMKYMYSQTCIKRSPLWRRIQTHNFNGDRH